MTKDEKLLVKVYEKTKADLRLLAKHEKTWNAYNNTILQDNLKKLHSKKQLRDLEIANQELKVELTKMGYTKFDDKDEFYKEFHEIGKEIILRIKDTITSIIPKNYKGEYCGVSEHYEPRMAQIYAGDGFCHSSFITDKGDKYCASPYGYAFLNLTKFGRILKDRTIKEGKVGRFGHFQYD